jgi:hypothetical protein
VLLGDRQVDAAPSEIDRNERRNVGDRERVAATNGASVNRVLRSAKKFLTRKALRSTKAGICK